MRNIVDKVCGAIICVLLSMMVIIACWQVFTRFVISDPSTVSEEVLRYSLIWLTMIGSAYAYGKKKHLAIVFVLNALPSKLQKGVNLIVEVVVAAFIVIILFLGGWQVTSNAVGQTSASIHLPMQYLYVATIISGVLFAFYCVLNIIDIFKPKQIEETEVA